MPKVTWAKPKPLNVPPANHIAELLKRYQKAHGWSNAQLGELLHVSGPAVSLAINRKPAAWRIADLLEYAAVLQIPFADVMESLNDERQYK